MGRASATTSNLAVHASHARDAGKLAPEPFRKSRKTPVVAMLIATPAKMAEWESRETPVVAMATTVKGGASCPGGLDLDLSGRDACGDGSDGGGCEDGELGLEADSEAASEVEGGADGAGDAASDGSDGDGGEDGRMGLEADAGAILKTTKRRRNKNRGVGRRHRRSSGDS
jgi:hypothetical protein